MTNTVPEPLIQATRRAAAALSEMAGQEIEVGSVASRQVPVGRLVALHDDLAQLIVAVHVGVEGHAGHLLLSMTESMARWLADMLLGLPPGTTRALGDLESSALAEVGNVAGTSLLTAVAELCGTTLPPTPPVVLYQTRGAMLSRVAANLGLAGSDEATLVDVQLRCERHSMDAALSVFSGPASARALFCLGQGATHA